jgi:PAS domain S-box-containing protein
MRSLSSGEWINDEEMHVVLDDGSSIVLLVSSYLPRAPRASLVVSFKDITGQRALQRAFKESEERYRQLFENMNDAFSLAKPLYAEGRAVDWRFLDANPAYSTLTGIPLDRVIGHLNSELFPQTEPIWVETVARVAEGREPTTVESFSHVLDRWYRVNYFSPRLGVTAMIAEDVTEQKQMEERLRGSEERYRELVESSKSIIMRGDKDFNITYINEFGLKFFGYSAEELLGRSAIGKTIPEKDDKGRDLTEMARELIRHPERFETNVHQNMRKDGERVWVSWTNHVKRDPDGNIAEVLAIGNDVSGLKKIEEALRESEEKFRAFFENGLDGVLLTTPEGAVLAVNREMCRILGMTEEEVTRKGMPAIAVQDSLLATALEERHRTGHFKGEVSYYHKDGRKIPIEASSAVFRDRRGRELVTTIARDITARKWGEEMARKDARLREGMNRVLQEAIAAGTEEQLGLVCLSVVEELTGSEMGFIGEIGEDGRLYSIAIDNPSWETCDMHDKTGHRSLPGAFGMHGLWGRVLAEGTTLMTNEPASHPDSLGVPEGHPRLKSFLGVPLIDRQRVVGIVAMGNRPGGYEAEHRDIVESLSPPIAQALFRKRAEDEVRRSRDELEQRVMERTEEVERAYREVLSETQQRLKVEEQLRHSQKMEAVGVLAGGIAHDFNNMLAVILGNAELVLDDLGDGMDGVTERIGRIVGASKRARDLVRQILMFSRKSQGKREPMRVAPLVNETVELLRGTLPSTIEIEVDVRTEADTICADPSQIQQVLMNLSTNASHAMSESGGTLAFSVSANVFSEKGPKPDDNIVPGRYVVLAVSDTGAGMTGKVRDRIFEPFFTTKEPGQGTGMGLAVVFGIVRSHGGTVSVDSEPGKGSIFKIYLPSHDGTAREERTMDSSFPMGTERVLVVDDEPSVVEIASETLKRLGYRVTTADGGPEGWETFREEPHGFDLVITDHIMPRLTGVALAEKIQRVRQDLPVILFTGYSDAISPEKAKAKGISGFLMKPVVVRELAEEVRRVLDGGDGE